MGLPDDPQGWVAGLAAVALRMLKTLLAWPVFGGAYGADFGMLCGLHASLNASFLDALADHVKLQLSGRGFSGDRPNP